MRCVTPARARLVPATAAAPAEYAAWMASAAWLARRPAWRDRRGSPRTDRAGLPVCGGRGRCADGDLHHRSYARLGHEADRDLSRCAGSPAISRFTGSWSPTRPGSGRPGPRHRHHHRPPAGHRPTGETHG